MRIGLYLIRILVKNHAYRNGENMEKTRFRICRLFILFLVVVSLTGCGLGLRPNMKKADDEISKAIYKKVGKKVSYETMIESTYGARQYCYLILDDKDESVLADMAEAINEILDEKDIGKLDLHIWEEWEPHTYASVLCMSNYDHNLIDSDLIADDSQLKYLSYLFIYGNGRHGNSLYNQASSYPTMEGIEYLQVIENVNKNAEEEGINWYEVFPDLKGYEVYKYENGERTIIYQEMKEEEASGDSEETEAP